MAASIKLISPAGGSVTLSVPMTADNISYDIGAGVSANGMNITGSATVTGNLNVSNNLVVSGSVNVANLYVTDTSNVGNLVVRSTANIATANIVTANITAASITMANVTAASIANVSIPAGGLTVGGTSITGGASGTVTSITAGTGLSGGTITTSGTIALDVYTGTTATNQTYPVGTYVVSSGMTSPTVNGAYNVYSPASAGGTSFATTSQSGSSVLLTGTWRARGLIFSTVVCSLTYYTFLTQRVA